MAKPGFPRRRGWRLRIAPFLVSVFGLLLASTAVAQEMSADSVSTTNHPSLGTILVGPDGMTLYTWDRDEPGDTVTTTAPGNWPLFIVSSVPMGPAGLPGTLGVATRSDGRLQATFNSKPLYYYVNDRAPGDATGQAVGNIWWVVSAAPAMMPGPTLTVSNTALGSVLADDKGMTLYTWDRDEPGDTVTTTASATWPLFIVDAIPVGPAGLPGTLGFATRLDGRLQATFNGKPLYYNANDRAAGDTNGQAAANLWWVVSLDAPTSTPMMDEPMMDEPMMDEPMMDEPMMDASTVGTTMDSRDRTVLTDSRGMSLYVFREDRENNNVSICYAEDGCAVYWPPVLVSGAVMAPPGLPGVLGTQARADFTTQLTYNGRPLYLYIADFAPGDMRGANVTDEWGSWFLVPTE